jgi:hypothetical protein
MDLLPPERSGKSTNVLEAPLNNTCFYCIVIFSSGQKSRFRRCKDGQNGGLTCSELLIQSQESDLPVIKDQVLRVCREKKLKFHVQSCLSFSL